jgi:hypothetical protein
MKSMNVYYDDLNTEAKAEFDGIFGPPEDFNHDVFPLFVYEVDEQESEG